ncbi:hypothetical protein K3727_03585 [Rhodobacteraceae bacterium M382]|nr:hypothetical protein K3727_20735 [Rhodobacteraceae bacterium M382]UWQ91895.1 hypothetical protein K3727_03585 [Rhodobacteraceae bacterium M382]
MFTKATFAAVAVALTASLASASTAPMPVLDTGMMPASSSYEVADTRGMDNRQDRRGDRQDCRQSEGAGHDKRDCKQDARQAG